ncbi:uncharacterized protein [Lepisosteus oculatus]
MAVVPATSNGVAENTNGTIRVKKGWLSKRTQFTHRWKPAWFVLKETELLYGDNEEEPRKTINMVGAHIGAGDGRDTQYSWTVTPKDSKRTFFLRAGSEAEQQEWMQAICEVMLGSSNARHLRACAIQ